MEQLKKIKKNGENLIQSLEMSWAGLGCGLGISIF